MEKLVFRNEKWALQIPDPERKWHQNVENTWISAMHRTSSLRECLSRKYTTSEQVWSKKKLVSSMHSENLQTNPLTDGHMMLSTNPGSNSGRCSGFVVCEL